MRGVDRSMGVAKQGQQVRSNVNWLRLRDERLSGSARAREERRPPIYFMHEIDPIEAEIAVKCRTN